MPLTELAIVNNTNGQQAFVSIANGPLNVTWTELTKTLAIVVPAGVTNFTPITTSAELIAFGLAGGCGIIMNDIAALANVVFSAPCYLISMPNATITMTAAFDIEFNAGSENSLIYGVRATKNNDSVLLYINTNEIRLQSCELSNTNAGINAYVVQVGGVDYAWISDCQIEVNGGWYGILLNGTGVCHIINNSIDSTAGFAGIYVLTPIDENIVQHNKVNGGDNGFYINDPAGRTKLNDNVATLTVVAGFQIVAGTTYCDFQNNKAHNNAGDGFYVGAAQFNNFGGCTAHTNVGWGFDEVTGGGDFNNYNGYLSQNNTAGNRQLGLNSVTSGGL